VGSLRKKSTWKIELEGLVADGKNPSASLKKQIIEKKAAEERERI